MAYKPLKPMDNANLPHPSANTTTRTENEILRDNGFAIVARPNYGEARWKKDGQIYLESDALRLCGVVDEVGGDQFRGAEPCCLGGCE